MFDGLQQTIDQLASWLSPVANKKNILKEKKPKE
jgi:archaellum component FlaC